MSECVRASDCVCVCACVRVYLPIEIVEPDSSAQRANENVVPLHGCGLVLGLMRVSASVWFSASVCVGVSFTVSVRVEGYGQVRVRVREGSTFIGRKGSLCTGCSLCLCLGYNQGWSGIGL